MMRIDTFDEVMNAGMSMFPLLALPVAAVIAGIALAVGLFRRSPLVIIAAVSTAFLAESVAMAARDTSPLPSSLDSLMMLLPLALIAGALPYLSKMVPVVFRAVRRRLPVREHAGIALPVD